MLAAAAGRFNAERFGVEQEVLAACPGARIARVDRDTMQRRGAIGAVLARFAPRTTPDDPAVLQAVEQALAK